MPKDSNNEAMKPRSGRSPRLRMGMKWGLMLGVAIIGIASVYGGYIYASSPGAIRNPKLEHYHFRMQILVDGKAEDFSTETYQTGYAKVSSSRFLQHSF